MKKETDLDSIKSTARTFLYLDINETPYGAMLVQHPFTNSGLVCLQNNKGHEFVNLLEDDNALVRWRDLMKDRIQECENVYQLYLLVNKPYRIAFLKYTVDFMSRDDMSQILADIWIGTESPNLDPNMSKAKLVSLFKKANPNELMNEDELRIFNQLADTVAKQISEFDNTQLAAYNALLPLVVGEYYESELISIKDLINLTYSVDDYPVASNIFNDTELGEMLIDNGMFEGIENLSDEMIEFLDAEKIGEAHRIEENGVYVNGCYISREGFEPKEVFNGESLPDNAVDNYLFRLDIADDRLLQNWITVPLNENSERFFNLTNVTEFKLIDFESAIPQISKYADGMHNKITLDELQRINELAKGFLFLDEIQSSKAEMQGFNCCKSTL